MAKTRCPGCGRSIRPRHAVDESGREMLVCPACETSFDRKAERAVGSYQVTYGGRFRAMVVAVVVVLAVATVAVVFFARHLSRANVARRIVKRRQALATRLARESDPSALAEKDIMGLASAVTRARKIVQQTRRLQEDAAGAALSDVERERLLDLVESTRGACRSVARAAAGLVEQKVKGAAGKSGSVEESDRLERKLVALESCLRGGKAAVGDDAETAKALADALAAVRACREDMNRVEPVTFAGLHSRLASGDRPAGAVELEAWQSSRYRFLFTTKEYSTDNQFGLSTMTRSEKRTAYDVLICDEARKSYAAAWRRVRDDLRALKASVAAAEAAGELSDEQRTSFVESVGKLADRMEADLDGSLGESLVFQSPDPSSFDDEGATTIVEEGETPRSPWDLSPSILGNDAAFRSLLGASLPEIERAIVKINEMSAKPVDFDELLPELNKPMGIPVFGDLTDAQERLVDRFNDYVTLFNAELLRRNRHVLPAMLEEISGNVEEGAPDAAFARVTLRCRAFDMPELVRRGLAKALGREPAPFVLVTAKERGK